MPRNVNGALLSGWYLGPPSVKRPRIVHELRSKALNNRGDGCAPGPGDLSGDLIGIHEGCSALLEQRSKSGLAAADAPSKANS